MPKEHGPFPPNYQKNIDPSWDEQVMIEFSKQAIGNTGKDIKWILGLDILELGHEIMSLIFNIQGMKRIYNIQIFHS